MIPPSKSQIRRNAREVRERIRYAINSLECEENDIEGRIEACKLWLNGAIELCRENEKVAVKAIQNAEKVRK